jgi:phytoene dehydrogenase-like protein
MEASENTTDPSVIIVGAGIAGLACAGVLERERVPYLLLEADQRIGGRIKTDHVDGYQLDHGFQVLQADCPEARKVLDYRALQLHA